MIRLYAVSILPLMDEACYEKCYLRSVPERQEKADALKMPDDKVRCIAAGLLLEYAYEKFRIEKIKELADANSFEYAKGQENDAMSSRELFPEKLPEVRAGLKGKPEFVFPEGKGPELHFNLSHSGNYVICAMADFEVGADVQMRTRIRESLLQRFCSEEERVCMDKCGGDKQRETIFARIWAPKEAVTKLTGYGIGQLLGRVHRDGSEDKTVSDENIQCHIWQGMFDEAHAWAVASYREAMNGEPEILEPVMVDEGELFYEGMF